MLLLRASLKGHGVGREATEQCGGAWQRSKHIGSALPPQREGLVLPSPRHTALISGPVSLYR